MQPETRAVESPLAKSIHGHMLELEILSDPALAKDGGRVPHRLERGQDVDRKVGA